MALRSINPYTGKLIKEFEEFTDDQIDIKQEISIETVDGDIIEYARQSASDNQTFIND